jgi:hypothetical protein
MGDKVFVDTVAWIALINLSDALHKNASARMAELVGKRRRLPTTDFVWMEVADALSGPAVRNQAIRFLNGLRVNRGVMRQLVDIGATLRNDRPCHCRIGDQPDGPYVRWVTSSSAPIAKRTLAVGASK